VTEPHRGCDPGYTPVGDAHLPHHHGGRVGQASATGSTPDPPLTTLAEKGFIHASQPAQVTRVGERLLPGRPDLVLLIIDTERVGSPVRYELVPGRNCRIPTSTAPSTPMRRGNPAVRPDPDGTFTFTPPIASDVYPTRAERAGRTRLPPRWARGTRSQHRCVPPAPLESTPPPRASAGPWRRHQLVPAGRLPAFG